MIIIFCFTEGHRVNKIIIFGRINVILMKTIAIVAGGDSSEFGISVKSAIEVSKALSPDI